VRGAVAGGCAGPVQNSRDHAPHKPDDPGEISTRRMLLPIVRSVSHGPPCAVVDTENDCVHKKSGNQATAPEELPDSLERRLRKQNVRGKFNLERFATPAGSCSKGRYRFPILVTCHLSIRLCSFADACCLRARKLRFSPIVRSRQHGAGKNYPCQTSDE